MGETRGVLYKLLGKTVWRLGLAYLRRRYARQAKLAAAFAAGSLALGIYLATRESGEG